MIISARPYPSIKSLFSSKNHYDLSEYDFYPLGRDALLSCMIQLGLQSGDSIIIPAYMCDSTIKPLRSYGYNLVYIDIDQNLSLSIKKIKEIISKETIKALLLVHYFGVTKEIDAVVDLCHSSNIKVIEDASHGLISQLLRDRKSIKGDVEIFSMRKNLPIIDGGALRINCIIENNLKKNNMKSISLVSDLKYLILRFLEKIFTSFGINIYGQFINNIKINLRNNTNIRTHNFDIHPFNPSWQLTRYLGNIKYLKKSQNKIVQNFNTLSVNLQKLGFRLFFNTVDDNVVPQVLILYDDNGGLVEHLRTMGIGAWRWPDIEMPDEVANNPDHYPNTVFFDKNLTLLPIHQSIDDEQINYIIQVLKRWKL